MRLVADILAFWFGPPGSALRGTFRSEWFRKDPTFDGEIRRHFLSTTEAAARGELDRWQSDRESALALVILLDQFPRNLYRGSPKAFAADPKARAVADAAIGRGYDRSFPSCERFFFYLPFEHSESLDDQERSVMLFKRLAEEDPARADGVSYALRHQEIVQRFGRFPHRNEALGRESTEAEVAFLKEPMSSF
ncbi:MAG: DUF924 domain-containing protein [Alphaproteobacteria bacterium]|nr:DUF924 domain-containing protein [Alphaproteobacteria bacterium]